MFIVCLFYTLSSHAYFALFKNKYKTKNPNQKDMKTFDCKDKKKRMKKAERRQGRKTGRQKNINLLIQ